MFFTCNAETTQSRLRFQQKKEDASFWETRTYCSHATDQWSAENREMFCQLLSAVCQIHKL